MSIPRDITSNFKDMSLYIQDAESGRKETVLLSFYNDDFDPDEDDSRKWSVTDIITILVVVITIIVIMKYIIWPNNPVDARRRRRDPFPQNYPYQSPLPVPGYRGLNQGNMFSIFP